MKFFRFPKKNTNLFEHWKNIIEQENGEKLIDISQAMCVCSDHFTPDQFHSKVHLENSKTRMILKSNAFPSFFGGAEKSFMVEILPSAEIETESHQEDNDTDAIEKIENGADKLMEIVDEPTTTTSRRLNNSRSTLSSSELAKIGSAEISRMERLQLEQTANNAILKLRENSRTISALRNKIKVLKRGKDRLMNKIKNFDSKRELIDWIKCGKVGSKFHHSVKEMSIQFSSISTAAYTWFRKQIGKDRLPHIGTLRRWTSTNNGEPGLNNQTLQLISAYTKWYFNKFGKKLYFALKFDEMGIRQGLSWVPQLNRFFGLCDYGDQLSSIDKSDGERIADSTAFPASKSLFLMIRAFGVDLSMPIGYILINSMTGKQKAQMVAQTAVLCKSYEICVKLTTCDGDKSHFTMMRELGAKIQFNKKTNSMTLDTQLHIEGLDPDEPTYAHSDPSHLLKTMRNLLAFLEILFLMIGLLDIFTKDQLKFLLGNFYDEEMLEKERKLKKRMIQWKYIPLLHYLQEDSEIRLANKLSRRVIEWEKNKMKVQFAAIALSNKTADAIYYCDQVLKIKEFKDSIYTVMFLKVANASFDILDSKNNWSNGLKRALSRENAEFQFSLMDSFTKFYMHLENSSGQRILSTARHTALTGMLMGFQNAKALYRELVLTDKLPYLKMHDGSQDELEHLFGYFRRHLGCNDNPTALALMARYKMLMSCKRINFLGGGNCDIKENDCMNQLTSDSKIKLANFPFKIDSSEQQKSKSKIPAPMTTRGKCRGKKFAFAADTICKFKYDSVTWMAGYVQRRVVEWLSCEDCMLEITNPSNSVMNRFIDMKKFGELVYPHRDIVKICNLCEEIFELESRNIAPNLSDIVRVKTFRSLDKSIFSCLSTHPCDSMDSIDDHRYIVIQKILRFFINSKSRSFANTYNLNQHDELVRHNLKNLIKVKNQ